MYEIKTTILTLFNSTTHNFYTYILVRLRTNIAICCSAVDLFMDAGE